MYLTTNQKGDRKMKTIKEVYLQNDHYSHISRATIPGAWIALIDGEEIPFADPWQFNNAADAMIYALDQEWLTD
jgi:hypothetical protein